MIELKEKQRISDLLAENFSVGEPYPLAGVAKFLSERNIRCKEYGYPRIKPMLADCQEFISLEEIVVGGQPQQNVVLRPWGTEGPGRIPEGSFAELVSMPFKTLDAFAHLAGTSTEEAYEAAAAAFEEARSKRKLKLEADQISYDMGFARITLRKSWYQKSSKPWHFSFLKMDKPVKGPEKKEKNSGQVKKPQEEEAGQRLKQEEKQELYRLLTSALPLGEQLHMAVVSKQLTEAGYSKEQYGFSRLKALLQELSEFLSFEEAVMGGVPQTLVVLHRYPQWEKPEVKKPESQERKNDRFSKLPPEVPGNVYLVPKTLARLNQCITGKEAEPSKEIQNAVCKAYEAAKRNGTFRFKNDSYNFDLGIRDQQGNPLVAAVRKSYQGGYPWYLNFAGPDRAARAPSRMLEQFADLGAWQEFLKGLAENALPEPWDFESSETKSYYILKKYIQYTFYRLQLEDKIAISDDRTFAAFNTGLLTAHYDDIYACFEASDEKYGQDWRFLEFSTAAGRGIGKRLVEYFNPLPQPASYYEHRESLLFDLEKELHTDFDHILLDNLSRFPVEFLKEECYGIPQAQKLIDQLRKDNKQAKKQRYQELSGLIEETPRLYHRLHNRLEDAIGLAKKQVRWNYKTAVPCYFPTRNVMNLLLPLSLTEDKKADAALVVELTRSGNYQGQTILTLRQAYLDGRLLCRPNSDWLDTNSIREEGEADADEE